MANSDPPSNRERLRSLMPGKKEAGPMAWAVTLATAVSILVPVLKGDTSDCETLQEANKSLRSANQLLERRVEKLEHRLDLLYAQ